MIGVYTCLLGPYDDVAPARFGGVLFTDQDMKPDGWEVRKVKPVLPDDLNRSSRYWFCQSCLVLPEYSVTIEHGADVQLQMEPGELIDRFLPDDRDIACFKHPHRSSVYEEGRMCGHWRKDDKTSIQRQMGHYEREGFPGDDLSTCILLLRRNTLQVQKFEAMWWAEVLHGSRRNQLSFDYCRWRLGIKVARIPGGPYRRGDIMKVKRHKAVQHFD